MPEFTSNNATIYYEVRGSGFPLIFTHGASWNHEQWKKQAEFFRETNLVVTWDVRGHGYSTLPPGPVNSGDFVLDLVNLMDHLKLEKAILCGLSLGGHISLRTAILHPERVQALVLIGTPCSNTLTMYERIAVPINRFSNRLLSMELLAKMQAKVLSGFNPHNYDYIVKAVNMIPKDNWIRLWDSITRMESKHELHKVKCPTLLLIGDNDNLTDRHQPYMQKRIKNSVLKTIRNAHHGTNLDNPDAVNREIMEFFSTL